MGKSKKQTSKLRTITRLTTHGKVKFFLRTRKHRILEEQLKNLLQRLIKKGVIDQSFLNFVRDIEPKEKQIEVWKEILNRKDLTSSDLYEISKMIEDEPLRKEAQEKYVAIALDHDLDDTIKYENETFQEIAWQERCERIKKGLIKKPRAREILIELFKDTPNYRIKIWNVLEWLEPTDKELQSLLILPFMDKMPDLSAKIERFIRKKKKKSDNVKLISEIQKTTEKLAKLKKGQ